MAESTDISWCDSTLNFWVGCTEVGPACDWCYARAWAARTGHPELWKGERRKTKTWGDIQKWQRRAPKFFTEHGRRQRVFSNSLADFFDNEVPIEWRDAAWAEIAAAPDLDFYLVTKRLPNVLKMLPPDYLKAAIYPRVVVIATVINQEEWDRDKDRLKMIKALLPKIRVGLSVEPMLGPINLGENIGWLDWVICGGESGGHARAMNSAWATVLLGDCQRFKVPFHFKQIGSNHKGWPGEIAGAGTYPQEWPEHLRVREWPREAV